MKTNVIYVADTSAMIYRPGPYARTWKRQLLAAQRVLSPPAGPLWYRTAFWWVCTPAGLFANFFSWFAGSHAFGAPFFMGWLMVSLFTPCAVIYYRNTKADALAREKTGR